MNKIKMLLSGTMPWEIWLDEHPDMGLDIAVVALLLCSLIVR